MVNISDLLFDVIFIDVDFVVLSAAEVTFLFSTCTTLKVHEHIQLELI